MIFEVNEHWRIATDQHQYMVQKNKTAKTGKTKGKTRWDSVGYYTSFASAINGLVERDLRRVDVETLGDALARVETTVIRLKTALHPHYILAPKVDILTPALNGGKVNEKVMGSEA